MPLWAQVTLKPDIINTNVLNNGKSNTGITCNPTGGHIEPISIEGHKAEWKNAQKKPKNSIISDAIKKINPVFKPFLTILVWWPSTTASLDISKNQKIEVITIIIKPNSKI